MSSQSASWKSRHREAQLHRLRSQIGHPDGPGDEIQLLKDAVEQLHPDLGRPVLQADGQGLGLPRPGEKGGKTLQIVFLWFNITAGISQLGGGAAAGQLHLQGGESVVPAAPPGELLGQGVQGVGPVRPRLGRVGGEAPVGVPDQVGHIPLQPGAVVGMEEDAESIRFHLIGGVPGVQGEQAGALVVMDHGCASDAQIYQTPGIASTAILLDFPTGFNRRRKNISPVFPARSAPEKSVAILPGIRYNGSVNCPVSRDA